MAVQARHLTDAFRVGGLVFLDEFGGCAPPTGIGGTQVPIDFPHSEMTWNDYGFWPRKRARVASDGLLEDRSEVVPPAVMMQQPVEDVRTWVLPSTSGRMPNGASISGGDRLSWLYQQGSEIDALVRLESERMRAGLEQARRRHARALMAAAERAGSGRLRAAEAELERALRRSAELEEKARQAAAECQAWMGVARSHEAIAAGLRATLDQLLVQSSPPCAAAVGEGDAEDAQSCCFEAAADGGNDDGAASRSRSRAAASLCKACGGGEACVLMLPCRHLCLCRACEAAVDACPVCAAAKNASLHVLLS